VNADSPWKERILEGCRVPIVTYGIASNADLKAENIALTVDGTAFELVYKGQIYSCRIPLVGRFNVYNCLAAIAVGLARQAPLDKILPILAEAPSVPGRLQPVPNARNLKIYVDFAHSDDALLNVLDCLQELKKGRLITIFGCGGDRDATKRPKMAQVAEELSDITIVTSDNPRSEDPQKIAAQIVTGFKYPQRHIIELDRRAAIARAIAIAKPEDILLIAGKGHETYQIFAHKTVEFDDAKVAAQLCQEPAEVIK